MSKKNKIIALLIAVVIVLGGGFMLHQKTRQNTSGVVIDKNAQE